MVQCELFYLFIYFFSIVHAAILVSKHMCYLFQSEAQTTDVVHDAVFQNLRTAWFIYFESPVKIKAR